MASNSNDKSKTTDRAKNNSNSQDEPMLLIRDDTTQLLMVVESSKISSSNKSSKLTPGASVSWQNNQRERWRGKVVHVGSEMECTKTMDTIEKNSKSGDTDMVQAKEKDQDKLQSTITIEQKAPENMAMDEEDEEDDEEDGNQESLHIMDEEENEPALNSKQRSTTQNSIMSTPAQGEKRTFDDNEGKASKPKVKRSKHGLTVPYSMYSAKEQECLALQAEVNKYKQEWMPRPRHPAVIEFLVDVTNILTGKADGDSEEEDIDAVINDIQTNLNMSLNELKSCHGVSATKTARHIMKLKYPNPSVGFKFNTISDVIVDSIIKYTRIANPNDPTEDAVIKHAMGNYIATFVFQTKARNSGLSKDVSKD